MGTIIDAIIRHKQAVIAAVAITGLVGYGLPLNQVAQASLAEDIIASIFGSLNNDNNLDLDLDYGNRQIIEQPIDQDIDQNVDQSERNTQSNTNTQTQTGVIDQDIAQGLVDGDDKAISSSESGHAKAFKKGNAKSISSSGDAVNANVQSASNDARLQQLQVQNVDQDNVANFGDDTANLAAANIAIPIAVPINADLDLDYGNRLLNNDD